MRASLKQWLSSIMPQISRNDLIIALFVTFLLVELSGFFGSIIEQFELWSFSLRQRSVIETRLDSHIDIIGMDDYTLTSPDIKRVFGRSPFRRDLYAYLVKFMDRANARYLAIDLGFSGGKDQAYPHGDEAFATAVKQASIPVASVISSNTNEQDAINLHELRQAAQRTHINLTGALDKIRPSISNTGQTPLENLVESPMQFLFSNSLKVDVTGTVRRVNLLTTVEFPPTPTNLTPTFPLMVALEGEKNVDVLPNGDFKTAKRIFKFQHEINPIIRWYGDNTKASRINQASSDQSQLLGPVTSQLFRSIHQIDTPTRSHHKKQIYPEYSLWDIVYSELIHQCGTQAGQHPDTDICNQFYANPNNPPQGQFISASTFQNHFVLVGTTFENNPGDTHATIYNKAHYHGVYIQANILDNLLHNDFIQRAPGWWTLAITLACAILIAISAYSYRIVYSLTLFSAIIGGYSFITLWAYQFGNLWMNWAAPTVFTVITFILSFSLRYLATEKRKQQLRFAFGKYVSPGAMELIEKNPEKLSLKGERRELTILFTDIRGFTHFSETNTPEDVQHWLTEYFSVMNKIIFKHNGAINKLMGDAIMAYWGFPVTTEEAPLNAVKAALEMRDAMALWNQDPSKPRFNIGVGINTGDVIIGNVGSQDFMDFTVIGDTVNVAARLESENKNQGTNIIISQQTLHHCQDHLRVKKLGNVLVKGKEEPITIYEPLHLLH